MKAAFRKFIRFTTVVSMMALGVDSLSASTAFPSGLAMEPLIGIPYKLFSYQRETDSSKAVNCITSVLFALRRLGYSCPSMNFNQAMAYWSPHAQSLRLGETPVTGKGVLLFTKEHFLLFYSDQNKNRIIDSDDRVIHAYFSPVQITTIKDWMKNSRPQEIQYIPINDEFSCPTDLELLQLKHKRTIQNKKP